MRPSFWMRASFCASAFACTLTLGAVAVLTKSIQASERTEWQAIEGLIGHTEDRRISSLRLIRALSGKPFVLVLGDSITEASQLPERVCGLPLVNAGIGGERVSSFLPFVEEIFSTPTKPAVTVVALGMNDTQARYWSSSKTRSFKTTYSLLLDMLPPDTIIASLTLLELSKELGPRMSQESWDAINASIIDTARERKATLVNLGSPVVASATTDGVHPSSESYLRWREKIIDAIKKRLGC